MNIEELSDTELIAYRESILAMHENRQKKLADPIRIERLKNRKIKHTSMTDHVNPEYKALCDRIEAEVRRRDIKVTNWSTHWR